jgi:hypothetical protein
MDTDMEEAAAKGPGPEVPVASVGEPGLEASVIEGSNATNIDNVDFVFDHT